MNIIHNQRFTSFHPWTVHSDSRFQCKLVVVWDNWFFSSSSVDPPLQQSSDHGLNCSNCPRDGPIFCTGLSILSAKNLGRLVFWKNLSERIVGSQTPVQLKNAKFMKTKYHCDSKWMGFCRLIERIWRLVGGVREILLSKGLKSHTEY